LDALDRGQDVFQGVDDVGLDDLRRGTSQPTETETMGKSTSGFWLMPRPRNTPPKPV